jgi:hypothetical protein
VLLPLSLASEKAFEKIAAESIKYAIVKIIGNEQIETLEVEVAYLRPTSRMLIHFVWKHTFSDLTLALIFGLW